MCVFASYVHIQAGRSPYRYNDGSKAQGALHTASTSLNSSFRKSYSSFLESCLILLTAPPELPSP